MNMSRSLLIQVNSVQTLAGENLTRDDESKPRAVKTLAVMRNITCKHPQHETDVQHLDARYEVGRSIEASSNLDFQHRRRVCSGDCVDTEVGVLSVPEIVLTLMWVCCVSWVFVAAPSGIGHVA